MTDSSGGFKSFMLETMVLKRWRVFLMQGALFFFVLVAVDVIFDMSAKKLIAKILGALLMSAVWAVFWKRAARPLGPTGNT